METTPADYSTEKILESLFKDFYYELLRCKEIALRTIRLDQELEVAALSAPPANEEQSPSDENSPTDEKSAANDNQPPHPYGVANPNVPVHAIKAISDIQNRLKNVLNAQATKIIQFFQDDSLSFRELQYAMVSLADETFLNMNWKGRFAWQNSLLEGNIFHSQSSGETIFQRIDAILSRYEPAKIGIARIYFCVLSLGFRGKYRDPNDAEIIKSYEQRLYAFIHGTNPSITKYAKTRVMPLCYEHTMVTENKRTLPSVAFWTKSIITFIVLYLFASYIIWYDLAQDIYKPLGDLFDNFSFFLSKKS
ncbi:MAG: DotU family type IV/VI secretion system protein [Holosporales bacterium]|jgi:type VI secretion system protein ImpK|nr:DotU family type IV/VI secretion system protein [Holosporales bacterium]